MKMFVPQATLISVYNAIVQPHFDYCSLVWDIGNAYLLEKLQKMQNRAARVITGKSYEVRSQSILQELGWQPLVDRWKQNKAVFMYKVKKCVSIRCGSCISPTRDLIVFASVSNPRSNDILHLTPLSISSGTGFIFSIRFANLQ